MGRNHENTTISILEGIHPLSVNTVFLQLQLSTVAIGFVMAIKELSSFNNVTLDPTADGVGLSKVKLIYKVVMENL